MSTPRQSENDVQVQGSTVYVLNKQRQPSNLWWASVQPGHDDEGRRFSDEECQAIAQRIAASLRREEQGEAIQPTVATLPVGELVALRRDAGRWRIFASALDGKLKGCIASARFGNDFKFYSKSKDLSKDLDAAIQSNVGEGRDR
jgi:antitoxin (DNA-binding transcriptional repressor) of toxin-antitoxin stability system